MDTYPVSNLKPNTYFDAPVFLENEYVLLAPDTPVTQDLINRLKSWKYRFVYTAGSPSSKPASTGATDDGLDLSTLEQDINEQEQKQESSSLYFNLLSFTEAIFNNYSTSNSLDIGTVSVKIKDLIDAIRNNRDLILTFPNLRHPVTNYLITHSVNTAILSLAIGDFLKLPSHRLIELGTAAFLHDIGMVKIPSSSYLNSRALSEQEQKAILAHPVLGYRILKSFSVHENIALGVLEHQERSDGSGYPKKLKSDAITLYGRIIGACCSYDAIISNRPYKEAKDAHQGILDLLTTNRKLYDETVVKALVYTLSIYPLGTNVLLSNDTRGVVYKANPDNPRYPFIKLLQDENGKKITEQLIVQTSKEKKLEIVRVLTPSESKSL
jgi:HD-GYP domain-containing protein (c-di-GMP phosphodiesterase class II)